MKPTVVEELLAQRDAVLFGTWVRRSPVRPGEACLLMRREDAQVVAVSNEAHDLLARAVCFHENGQAHMVTGWNDSLARNRTEVLEVLDDAIRLAKESEA